MSRATVITARVNRNGYRIVPKGVKLDNYLKNPVLLHQHNQYALPIGKVTELKYDPEMDALTFVPVFDEKDEHGKEISRKYKEGYFYSFSAGHKPLKINDNPEQLMPGQYRGTVEETELLEISIVSVPGDAGAVKLSVDGDKGLDDVLPAMQLSYQSQKNTDVMDDKIIKALGLDADAKPEDAVAKISEMKAKLTEQRNLNVDNLITQGKAKGVITDDNEAKWRNLANLSFTDTMELLSATPAPTQKKEEEQESAEGGSPASLADLLKLAQAGGKPQDEEVTFEKLSKENPEELHRIQREDPELYDKLAADYAAGK